MVMLMLMILLADPTFNDPDDGSVRLSSICTTSHVVDCDSRATNHRDRRQKLRSQSFNCTHREYQPSQPSQPS